MKRFNKFLALFLAVVMTVGLLPAAVSAATDPNVIYEENFESFTATSTLQVSTSVKAWRAIQYSPYNHLDPTATGAYTFLTEESNTYIRLNAIASSANQANSFTVGSVLFGLRKTDATYPIAVGDTYKVTARVKANKAGSNVKFFATTSPWNSSFNLNETQTGVVGTDWTEVSYTFTVPTDVFDTMQIRVGLDSYTSDSGAFLMVDDICISKVVPYEYEDMETELAAGKATLRADVDGAGNDLILKSGMTLDLNGKTLTVDSLSALGGAKVKDTVGGGKVVVADGNLALQADNGYLPIKVDGGYAFCDVNLEQDALDNSVSDALTYETKPSFGNYATYLSDGAADNGLSILVRLTWTNGAGTTTTMDIPCSQADIMSVYTEGKNFEMTVSGVEDVTDLEVSTVVCSDLGVVLESAPVAYVAP